MYPRFMVLPPLVMAAATLCWTPANTQEPAQKTAAEVGTPKSNPHAKSKRHAQSSPASKPAAVKSPEEEDLLVRANVQLVLLDVSVKDPDGGFVSGLTKDNFKVLEDGKAQAITQFANTDIPVTVGLVVDNSGSMRPKQPEVITAGLAFAQASNPRDEFFVINFNERVTHGLPDTVLFTDKIPALRAALAREIPQGRTALYDAMVSALKQLDMGRQAKKTLLVISDGGDNISTHNFKDVHQMAQQSIATIYTIGIFSEDDPDKNPGVLSKLAKLSGGEVFFPQKLDEIVPIMRKIAKDIRTRYTIGFVPAPGGEGKLHKIKVEVNAPDRGKLIARTRTEYRHPRDEMVAQGK